MGLRYLLGGINGTEMLQEGASWFVIVKRSPHWTQVVWHLHNPSQGSPSSLNNVSFPLTSPLSTVTCIQSCPTHFDFASSLYAGTRQATYAVVVFPPGFNVKSPNKTNLRLNLTIDLSAQASTSTMVLDENNGPALVVTIWPITIASGTVLGLRIFAKISRGRYIWWDGMFDS